MRSDLSSSIFLIIFSIISYFFLIPWGVQRPSILLGATLPPDFFPKVLTILLFILSVIFLSQTLSAIKTSNTAQITQTNSLTNRQRLMTVTAVAIMGVYLWLIPRAGWLPATLVGLPLLMIYFGSRRWVTITIMTALMPVLVYLFFERIALVPLPKGAWF